MSDICHVVSVYYLIPSISIAHYIYFGLLFTHIFDISFFAVQFQLYHRTTLPRTFPQVYTQCFLQSKNAESKLTTSLNSLERNAEERKKTCGKLAC